MTCVTCVQGDIANASSASGAMAGVNPMLNSYIAWYGLSVSVLAPVAGQREIRAYGPGLENLYFPGQSVCTCIHTYMYVHVCVCT